MVFRAHPDLPVVPICRRRPRLPDGPETLHESRRPALCKEGRIAIVTNVGCGMLWPRQHREDERSCKRTAKPCGPDAPTLASSWRDDPLMMGAQKPGSPGG